MAANLDPSAIELVLAIGELGLWAFLAFLAAVTIIYAVLFWRGNLSGESIAMVIQKTDAAKFATIIIIVVSASVLGTLSIIEGEAIIALLSGIAGYVLGNRTSADSESQTDKDQFRTPS